MIIIHHQYSNKKNNPITLVVFPRSKKIHLSSIGFNFITHKWSNKIKPQLIIQNLATNPK